MGTLILGEFRWSSPEVVSFAPHLSIRETLRQSHITDHQQEILSHPDELSRLSQMRRLHPTP